MKLQESSTVTRERDDHSRPPELKTSAKKGGKATRRKKRDHTLMAGLYVEECECLWGSVRKQGRVLGGI